MACASTRSSCIGEWSAFRQRQRDLCCRTDHCVVSNRAAILCTWRSLSSSRGPFGRRYRATEDTDMSLARLAIRPGNGRELGQCKNMSAEVSGWSYWEWHFCSGKWRGYFGKGYPFIRPFSIKRDEGWNVYHVRWFLRSGSVCKTREAYLPARRFVLSGIVIPPNSLKYGMDPI